MNQILPKAVAVVLFVGLSSCATEDEFDLGISTKLEGIYSLDSFHKNQIGCDSIGDSVLESESDKFFLLKNRNVFGLSIVTLVSCESIDECRSSNTLIDNDGYPSNSYNYTFSSGSDDVGLIGQASNAYPILQPEAGGPECTGKLENKLLTEVSDGSLKMTNKITLADAFNKASNGFCSPDDVPQAAEDNICGEMHTLKGTFLENI